MTTTTSAKRIKVRKKSITGNPPPAKDIFQYYFLRFPDIIFLVVIFAERTLAMVELVSAAWLKIVFGGGCLLGLVAGLVLLLCFFVLFIPCRYMIKGEWQEGFRGSVKIALGPFTVRRLETGSEADGDTAATAARTGKAAAPEKKALPGKTGAPKKGASPDKTAPSGKKAGAKEGRLWLKVLLRLDREAWGALLALAGKFWAKLRPRVLRIRGSFGCADPYHTGLLAAVAAAVPLPWVHLEPDFSQEGFCGKIFIEGRFFGVTLMALLLKGLLTKPLRTVIRAALK